MSTSCISIGKATLLENSKKSLIRTQWVSSMRPSAPSFNKETHAPPLPRQQRDSRVVYPCLAVVGERPVVRRFKSCMFSSNHLAGHCIYVSAASGVRCSPW
jgi:hypothetical protein